MTHYQVENIDTTPLVVVASEATLRTALEAMFSNGVSQLGIADDGELTGVVTHRSITVNMDEEVRQYRSRRTTRTNSAKYLLCLFTLA